MCLIVSFSDWLLGCCYCIHINLVSRWWCGCFRRRRWRRHSIAQLLSIYVLSLVSTPFLFWIIVCLFPPSPVGALSAAFIIGGCPARRLLPCLFEYIYIRCLMWRKMKNEKWKKKKIRNTTEKMFNLKRNAYLHFDVMKVPCWVLCVSLSFDLSRRRWPSNQQKMLTNVFSCFASVFLQRYDVHSIPWSSVCLPLMMKKIDCVFKKTTTIFFLFFISFSKLGLLKIYRSFPRS